MAVNSDLPFGMKPLYMTEARKTCMYLPITNNYGTALYVFDPALAVTAGTIEKASTTGPVLGSILGLYRAPAASLVRTEQLTPVNYMGASPGAGYTYFALVTMDPTLFFIMQEDADASSLTIANNWGSINLIYTHGGSTVTGISKAELDSSSVNNTATLPMQLIMPAVNHFDIDKGAYLDISSAAAGQFGKWICRVFNSQLGSGSLAVAFAT